MLTCVISTVSPIAMYREDDRNRTRSSQCLGSHGSPVRGWSRTGVFSHPERERRYMPPSRATAVRWKVGSRWIGGSGVMAVLKTQEQMGLRGIILDSGSCYGVRHGIARFAIIIDQPSSTELVPSLKYLTARALRRRYPTYEPPAPATPPPSPLPRYPSRPECG